MSVRSADVSAIYELLYNPKYVPERSPTARIELMTIEGQPTYILTKEAGEYFEVDEITNAIWNLMDGRRTVSQIQAEASKPEMEVTQKEVRDSILSLAEEGLIATTEPEIEEKRVEMVSAFQLDVRVVRDSSKALSGFFKITRKLVRKWELPVAVVVVIIGFFLLGGSSFQTLSDPTKLQILGSTLLGAVFYQEIILMPVYLVHELAHASTCDYYGGKPRELGTGLYYFATFFYCDTSDSWRLSRKARIMISVAGPLSTLVIGSLLVFSSYFVASGFGKNALDVASFFCFYGSLVNFSPVIETDGYYILSDVLKLPNLRDESFAYFKRGILRLVGRKVKKVSYTTHTKRILLIYSIMAIAWLFFFAYTTLTLTYFYSEDAFHLLSNLFQILIRATPFSAFTILVSIAGLVYFVFLIAGYFIMGVAAYQKIRIRGIKLETIQDKRVSIFLPLPSFFKREQASKLLEPAKGLAKKLTRSFSVIWEPPLCVAALKLGKVDQSLEQMRRDMLSAENSFKSIHYRFLSKNLPHSLDESSSKKLLVSTLNALAGQFPPFERKQSMNEVSKFLKRQDTLMLYLLHSAFGSVWTLELSPTDYKRIRRELFPNLVAEDLGVAEFGGELERFKRYTVLGLDALSKLSLELDKEAGRVNRRPEQYQATTFIEPVKSRLVFVGRTEGIERSIVWLGGLFLYQAWAGYTREILYEASLGLRSISQSSALGKSQAAKLSREDLDLLLGELNRITALKSVADNALSQIKSALYSAQNFHESLVSLLDDQNFDVGLYEPILGSNNDQLKAVRDKIEDFGKDYLKAFEQISKTKLTIEELSTKDDSKGENKKGSIFGLFGLGSEKRNHSSDYYANVKLLYALTRLLYSVTIASDVIT